MRGFSVTATLFPGGTLKNATHTSPGNPEQSNQSDDDFDTPEVFPNKCTILLILYFFQKGHIEIKMNFFFQGVLDMHQTFSQLAVGMTYEAETTDYMAPILGSKWTCWKQEKWASKDVLMTLTTVSKHLQNGMLYLVLPLSVLTKIGANCELASGSWASKTHWWSDGSGLFQ